MFLSRLSSRDESVLADLKRPPVGLDRLNQPRITSVGVTGSSVGVARLVLDRLPFLDLNLSNCPHNPVSRILSFARCIFSKYGSRQILCDVIRFKQIAA